MSALAPYRLVWFQHFHRAGGTSLVDLALGNGESPWPRHENGNPCEPDGREIRLWDFTPKELTRFVDECESGGVTFVATEWGVPDLTALAGDPRVYLFTCLRRPLDRFVSNFYFDLHSGYTPARNLRDYVGSRDREITMPNYYCRMLARHYNRSMELDEKHFEAAKVALACFDRCLILEESFEPMTLDLGWKWFETHANRSRATLRQCFGLIRRRRFDLLRHVLLSPKSLPLPEFTDEYERTNRYDIELYRMASAIARANRRIHRAGTDDHVTSPRPRPERDNVL
jgi:hypothetical protein